MTLTDFLLARIAEDEAFGRGFGMHEGFLAKRWSAEAEAKRQLVADHEAVALRRALADDPVVKGFTAALTGALESLATVYADHPDYREEWKP